MLMASSTARVVVIERLFLPANALRDYETLSQEAVPDQLSKPWLSDLGDLSPRFGTFIAQRLGKEAELMKWITEKERREKLLRDIPRDQRKYMFRELNREIRLEQEQKAAYSERLSMGLFGGIALIAPMLLMVLHRDRNTSIITTSVATVLFAVSLAGRATDLGGKDVLAATAAYAAVLVVFVGASLSPVS
jgi:hypothetical protein